MKRIFNIAISATLLFTMSCTSVPHQVNNAIHSRQVQQQTHQYIRQQLQLLQSGQQRQGRQQQTQQPQTAQNWTGDGGRGISLTILSPRPTGLAENQSHLPTLVQGEFVSNFSNFSAISILDWERLDAIYDNLLSGFYADNAEASMDLGRLTPTTHIMGGNITRTATGFTLQMHITRTADKMTTASYSGTFSFAELDNLTGIRQASLELLQKMGVTLTAQAQTELRGAATASHVSGQTALARGITAQRQGTEVAALSYYFMAATFDPSLREAVNRSSILNTNISSGNIGMDVRNEIAWRRQWVERLTETERFFDSFHRTESMPYTLFYLNDIRQGTINWQTETVTLSTETYLYASGVWALSIERALQAVYDGLNATGRMSTWGLANWPRQGVTNLNAFAERRNNFSVVFELLNNQNRVIGRQTLQAGGSWGLNWSGRPVTTISSPDRGTMNFQNVNANDITDSMTIRVATVNGTAAETAARNGVLQIRAVTRDEVARNDRFRFSKGNIQGFSGRITNAGELVIPNTIWGDQVISIGREAFRNTGITRVTIPDSVTAIGTEAFWGQRINPITIGQSVAMGEKAFGFRGSRTVKSGGVERTVYFDDISFLNFYAQNDRKGGTYTRGPRHWIAPGIDAADAVRMQRNNQTMVNILGVGGGLVFVAAGLLLFVFFVLPSAEAR
jgi:hypothetical protein